MGRERMTRVQVANRTLHDVTTSSWLLFFYLLIKTQSSRPEQTCYTAAVHRWEFVSSVSFVLVHRGEVGPGGEDRVGRSLWEPDEPRRLHQTLDGENVQTDGGPAAAQPKYDIYIIRGGRDILEHCVIFIFDLFWTKQHKRIIHSSYKYTLNRK